MPEPMHNGSLGLLFWHASLPKIKLTSTIMIACIYKRKSIRYKFKKKNFIEKSWLSQQNIIFTIST